MSCILMVIFLFTCCVVLLNILIAQLSDTYQNVQRDAQRGLELNRAWIIARVELNSLFIRKVISPPLLFHPFLSRCPSSFFLSSLSSHTRMPLRKREVVGYKETGRRERERELEREGRRDR